MDAVGIEAVSGDVLCQGVVARRLDAMADEVHQLFEFLRAECAGRVGLRGDGVGFQHRVFREGDGCGCGVGLCGVGAGGRWAAGCEGQGREGEEDEAWLHGRWVWMFAQR